MEARGLDVIMGQRLMVLKCNINGIHRDGEL